jgi:peptidoglycan/LPS O-acetylase OafA/YrhL
MTYRPDIDGLRAIAVGVVVLYHFGIGAFGGGFVGVDVFFVISGYLIGSLVLRQMDRGAFSFLEFYGRRMRRLFPAYAVVAVATSIAAVQILLPADLREFGQSLLSASIYVSNIHFYLEAGYFDAASDLKPLLHTWSLGVEEQFYLFFPPLLYVLVRWSRRNARFALAGFAVLSFAASLYLLERDPSAAFYLFPFRAWELFLGVLMATPWRSEETLRLPPYIAELVALTGLVLLLAPVLIYDSSTPFPGLTALLPCGGTALIILAGETSGSTMIGHTLASRPFVFVGQISYSVYLWHWPLYMLFAYRIAREPTASDVAMLTALTVLLAYLSWRFVEAPLRSGRAFGWDRWSVVFLQSGTLAAVFCVIGLAMHLTNGLPERLDERELRFARASESLFGSLDGCTGSQNALLPDVAFCELNAALSSPEYVLFWTDSHGGAYKSTLEQSNEPVLLAWTGGCPPLFDVVKRESAVSIEDDRACARRNNAIRALMGTDRAPKATVLMGRWSYYLNGGGVGNDAHNSILLGETTPGDTGESDQAAFFLSRFRATVAELVNSGQQVFVVEQPPEFPEFHARRTALALMRNMDQTDLGMTVAYEEVRERQAAMQDLLSELERNGQASILRTHEQICGKGVCSVMDDGIPAYYDNNHISHIGASRIGHILEPVFGRELHAPEHALRAQ